MGRETAEEMGEGENRDLEGKFCAEPAPSSPSPPFTLIAAAPSRRMHFLFCANKCTPLFAELSSSSSHHRRPITLRVQVKRG